MTGGTPPDRPASDTVPASLSTPDERVAYERAARWAGMHQRQALHDHATILEAYFLGFLGGMRDDPAEHEDVDAPADAVANAASAERPEEPALTHAELAIRARVEGYSDGRRWRERGKLGGLVRLAIAQSGKSARRFANEDLVRDHGKVRAWQTYKSNVPDIVADELLRRLNDS